MNISRETDYALRIVLFLSARGMDGKVGANEIAEKMELPERFNLKILRKLTAAGITRSYRGIYGGYAIAKPAKKITMLEVLEAIEGKITLNRCLGDAEFCTKNFTETCPVHHQFDIVNGIVTNYFGSVNFQELVDDLNKKNVEL